MMPNHPSARAVWCAVLAGFAAGIAAAESEPANAGTQGRVVDRQLAEYAGIDHLSCQIRRETVTPQARSRFLSTIYWHNDGRMHVDNIEPQPRTIVADGTNSFSYVRGAAAPPSSTPGRNVGSRSRCAVTAAAIARSSHRIQAAETAKATEPPMAPHSSRTRIVF